MTTKIIITIGPKSEAPEKLTALMQAGADFVRVNFSHATYEQYRRVKKIVDHFNQATGRRVAMIQDLQGPRIRVGRLPDKGLSLKEGDNVRLSFCGGQTCAAGVITIDSSDLHLDIKKGESLFLNNGEIEINVTSVANKIISGRVVKGGLLTSHKGINIPNTNLKKGGLTPKDIKDVKFALKTGVDFIALSFIQSADDVRKLRRIIGKKSVKIISKIERFFALKNIDEIISVSDAVMIARGDLGIEIPIEDLLIVQKHLVRHAHWHDKPAIIATQIMTSMIKNPHPTRAEISDIANAVLDGADLVMLSDETAVGDYALEAVRLLKKVIARMERYILRENVVVDYADDETAASPF